jgi:hypothetical protein
MSWISIDVDLDDVYRNMDRSDKRTMVEWLDEDGYLEKEDEPLCGGLVAKKQETYDDKVLRESLNIIWRESNRMSEEETELIRKIAEKYGIIYT